MDKLQKMELMNKIVRELEDLQNSQTALIEKIGKIEVDNMNGLNDKFLEKNLGEMHSKIVENVDAVSNIFTHFEEQRDSYAEKNKSAIEALEAQAAIEAANE
jgi:L-lactate utilization protein LutB